MKFHKKRGSAYLLKIQIQMAIEEHAKLSTTIMYMCYNEWTRGGSKHLLGITQTFL